jgi:hypothetical protein
MTQRTVNNLTSQDVAWVKQYCSNKFRAKHPDYDDVYNALLYAYKQGIKAGEMRQTTADHTGSPPELIETI